MNWLVFALLTVLSWGVYGVLLHKGRGQMPMGAEARTPASRRSSSSASPTR